MQKAADAADISVLVFSAGANFWAILAILGNFWAILGNFRSFLGYFFGSKYWLVLIFYVFATLVSIVIIIIIVITITIVTINIVITGR